MDESHEEHVPTGLHSKQFLFVQGVHTLDTIKVLSGHGFTQVLELRPNKPVQDKQFEVLIEQVAQLFVQSKHFKIVSVIAT